MCDLVHADADIATEAVLALWLRLEPTRRKVHESHNWPVLRSRISQRTRCGRVLRSEPGRGGSAYLIGALPSRVLLEDARRGSGDGAAGSRGPRREEHVVVRVRNTDRRQRGRNSQALLRAPPVSA